MWRTLITLLIRGAARMCSAGPKTQSKCPEDTHLKRAVFHSTSTAKRHWTPPPAGSDDLLAQAQRLRKDVRAFLEDALLEQTPASFEAAAMARGASGLLSIRNLKSHRRKILSTGHIQTSIGATERVLICDVFFKEARDDL